MDDQDKDLIDIGLYDDGSFLGFRFQQAPQGLATRRQLRAMHLSPGGHEPVAQLTWHNGKRKAWLYRVDLAKPKRTPTLAQERALDQAMAARQTCPKCRRRYIYCLPLRTQGCCNECNDGTRTDPSHYTAPPLRPRIDWPPESRLSSAQHNARSSRLNFQASTAVPGFPSRSATRGRPQYDQARVTGRSTSLPRPSRWPDGPLHTTILRRRLAQAQRDPLTSTWRRKEFTDHAQRLLERHPDEVVLVLADADHFKQLTAATDTPPVTPKACSRRTTTASRGPPSPPPSTAPRKRERYRPWPTAHGPYRPPPDLTRPFPSPAPALLQRGPAAYPTGRPAGIWSAS